MANATDKRDIRAITLRGVKVAISMLWYAGTESSRALARLSGHSPKARFIVLYYHEVSGGARTGFARQMEALSRRTKVVRAAHTGAFPDGGSYVAITFDDAFRSVRTNALPELLRRGFPATIFVPVDWVGKEPGWNPRDDVDDEVMTGEELRSLPALIELGSHTLSHPHLTKIGAPRLREEVTASRHKLAELIGSQVSLLAFPYGDYNECVVGTCSQAGYERVFAIEPWRADPSGRDFVRGRVAVDPYDGPLVFHLKARARMDGCRTPHRSSGDWPLEEIPIGIIVRKASRSDEAAIARFIEDAYGPLAEYKTGPHWTWQFIDNPLGPPGGDEIPVWVALDGKQVVGQIAVQRALLQVQGETLEAGWAVDIMILPSHRGTGIGHRLHDAVAGEVDILLSLKMADASRRMAKRQGSVSPTQVHQLTRWVRLDAVSVRRYVLLRTANHRWPDLAARVGCNLFQLHRLFCHLANPVLRLRDLIARRRSRPGGACIVEIERFGAEIDELWERTRREYPVIFPRDAQFLNWRFVNCPQPSYRCFVAQRAGRAVGYVVLRRSEPVELSQGIIVDLYASRGDTETIDQLVRHSLAFFGDDVPAVDYGTSVPEFESVLRRHGFFRTRAHLPTCVCRDTALSERLTRLGANWFLSKGDHDWDQIYLATPGTAAE